MKIAYLVTDLGLGGTQRWVELAATELVKRGHCVFVLVEQGPFDLLPKLQAHGILVRCYEAPPRLEEYAQILLAEKPDIVHLHVYKRWNELPRLRSLTGIPLAISYHHVPRLSYRTWIRRLVDPRAAAAYVKHIFWARRYIDAHIGCCERSAQGIQRELWPFGVSRVFALCNAIPIPDQVVSTQVMEGPPRFLQIGWLSERKRPNLTLSAFVRVREAYPEATLTFLGEGPLRPYLEDLIASQDISGVQLVGPQIDIEPFFMNSNIVVLPSVDEGLPYALIEAAGRGIPIIAAAVGGVPEICVHNSNGILVKPDSLADLERAMLRLASSGKLRRKMGQNGRQLVEQHFEIGQHIEKLLGIYACILAKNKFGSEDSLFRRGHLLQ